MEGGFRYFSKMRNTQFSVLLSNLFIIASFIVDSPFSKLGLIFIGAMWLIGGMVSYSIESRIENLNKELDHQKFLCLLKAIESLRSKK